MSAAAPLPAGLAEPIPFYVTPFYNSEGPEINIGPLSQALLYATPDSIGPMAEALGPSMAYQPAVALFVLAVRLFDLGQRDEGLYWFYQAQYRARLLHRVLDPEQVGQMFDSAFELESAHRAFMDLAGPHFNGYAGCSQERWLDVIARVQAENQTAPDFSFSYPGLALRPAAEWPALNQQVNDGMRQLAEAIREDWDEMQAQRRENGTHERFCVG